MTTKSELIALKEKVEKGCERVGCGNRIDGILCLCKVCRTRLDTLSIGISAVENTEKQIFKIIREIDDYHLASDELIKRIKAKLGEKEQ